MSTTGETRGGKESSMIIRIVGGLLLDAGLAVGTYLLVMGLGYSIFTALVAAVIVAGVRAVYVIIKRRTVDAFNLFMILTFGVGLVLAFVAGTPRFLLAKDSIGTGVTAIAFAVTLFVGRPMMFYFSQRFGAPTQEIRQEWARLWETTPGFRRHFWRMTLVWAIAFAAEALIKLAMIMTLPVTVMAPLVPFFTPVLITGLLVWTIRSSRAAQDKLNMPAESS